MNTHKIVVGLGDNFHQVCQAAKEIAELEDFKEDAVEFEFNDIVVLINRTTNLELIWRDYLNSHLMEWPSVGPNCFDSYPPDIAEELARRQSEQKEKEDKANAERKAKDDAQQNAFKQKTAGIEIDLSDKEGFESWKENNKDPYSACIFEYAESWAKLMQKEMADGKSLREVAEKTSYELGYLGITGFMYGAAVSILSQCWKHGEELRKWHNKEYGHEGDGVVNPAILTVKS